MCLPQKFIRPVPLLPLCALLFAAQIPAQLPNILGGNKPAPAAAAVPADPLKRTTPRSAIINFLEACHNDRFDIAARYLDLRSLRIDERTSEGTELAKQLADLLDRDPKFELGNLSDNPAGNSLDGLAPDLDVLATLNETSPPTTLQMQRITQMGSRVWVVSAESLTHIPQLAALSTESSIEKRLPPVLVQTELLGTPIWVWLALVTLGLLLSLLSRLLSRAFLAIIIPVTKHYSKSFQSYRAEAFVNPLRLLLSVMVFRALMELVAPSALLRDYLLKLLTLFFALGAASLIMAIVDLISDHILNRLSAKERTLSYSVLPLGVRFVKICIFCIAGLSVLAAWGYNTNAILAGVGVGGLAVALAAQKTIENLFGGVALITDRPVLVGDFCQYNGQVGTIEDIGLRSTRIRTLDRSVVTIPNSSFSTMTLENLSRRDQMWFHPTIRLRRDTSPHQVSEMMEALTAILRGHPMVSIGGIPLRFTKISEQSLDLEIFSYVTTDDYDVYLKVQNELLLQFLEASVDLGISFAMPLQEVLNVTLPPEVNQRAVDGFQLNGAPQSEHRRPG